VGREVVSTGTGMAGGVSTIFLMGRATSIRFFCGGVVSVQGGAGGDAAGGITSGTGCWSRVGRSRPTGCWIVLVIFCRSARNHSSLSLLRSPPEVLEKVSTI
jgi:hypothetical protein